MRQAQIFPGMSDDELMDQSEVFAIADGRFLVVEG